ncbi:MAG: hypothetical protein H6624_05395 [Bdellovibrionaceae bacterium]|nr:hypothetical protein [Bdellovibrionales bacterium]MCB9083754.1 hypothetical protein [Pseudobdellovibrionaceae bacterium]
MKKLMLVWSIFVGLSAQAVTWQDMKVSVDNGQAYMELFDEQGSYVGKAGVFSEEWKGDELSKYVVRYVPGTFLVEFNSYEFYGWTYYSQQDAFYGVTQQGVEIYWGTSLEVSAQAVGGQFVTGLKGKLEKWDLGGDKELYRLVFRKAGKFVTWAKADDQLTEGWNQTANGIRYEIRWANGKLADSALASKQIYSGGKLNPKAFMCFDNQICPALAIRDTESGPNNGKFLTVVYGKLGKDLRCYYHAKAEKSLDKETSGDVITHQSFRKLNKLCD